MKSVLRGMKSVNEYISENVDVEGETVTIRPSATAILAIDSDDRYANYAIRRTQPSYPFSIALQKNQNILSGFFKRLALTEFRLNWTLPNISRAWRNNTLSIVWRISAGASTTTLINLDDGFYGAQELAEEIQRQIVSAIPSFKVALIDDENNAYVFDAPATYTFYIQNMGSQDRELVDILNIQSFAPGVTGTFVNSLRSGIPNLRALDYFDIICSELSYNQELKDATSAPISRDMIARIYLDDSVPSQALIQTNVYNNTVVSQAITAGSYTNPIFTITVGSTTNFRESDDVVVSGIVGGTDFNGSYIVVSILSITQMDLTPLNNIPSGTPSSFAGSTVSKFNINEFQLPQTTWDDRVNGVSPFVIYRQFAYPKQIRWNNKMPIGNLTFELYDDQGRNIQELWNSVYPANSVTGLNYANSFVWNATILVSED